MLHEVSVRVKTLRHLPQQFFQDEKERELALSKRQSNASHRHQHGRGHGRGGVDQRRCLRAQASISNETRETGNSVWGRGMRSREAIWLRGVDTLSWSLPEQQFKLVKAYTPVCKVHVYATDASTPTMDTSDAVGWFVVDMRDLAGQRQQERWVKLQGASPAEVLISSSLAMARDRADLPKQKLSSDPTDVPLGFPPSVQADCDATREDEEKEEVPAQATGTPNPTDNPAPATATAPPAPATATATPAPATATPTPSPATATPTPALATATPPPANPTPTPAGNASRKTIATATATAVATTALPHAEAAQPPAPVTDAEVYRGQENESAAVLTTTAAEAVSDLEALPVGPGADGPEARTFSLSISVKGAAGLSRLVPSAGAADGGGFWFSYSIFGVVVQTDRFERLAAPPPGNGPVLEPMLDSFRLRATLQGLCEFLGEAPPLQVYLCTEGCILAHADIDMARLLPRGEWSTRTTSQFCRTGLEGDFCLRLPGEMSPPPPDQREALEGQRGNAVVTIAAELTRAGATPGDCIRREAGTGAKPGSGGGEAGNPGMRTWAFLAAKRPQGGGGEGVITASLRRLVLRPAARGGDTDRLQRVLVGFHGAGESLPPRDTAVGATAAAPAAAGVLGMGKDGSVSLRGFQVVGCNDRGEMDTEDTSLLGNILWKWEGDFPQDDQQLQRGGRPLAKVRVLDDGAGHGEVAAGVVPWPSLVRSGRQQVDVKLLSPEGFVIGSCRVCLGVAMGKGVVDVGTDREAVEDGNGSVISEEESKRVGLDGVGQVERVDTPLVGNFLGRVGADAAVSSKGVQAEEAALEGDQKVAGGDVPRSYRLSVNLASVKDLENAAYVVARYHYPYFGTSAPVRTSLVWVAPRMDTPLSNSCCTFSFGMSLDRLSATVHDRKLVVSLRNKDRFKEEEVGLVTLPLEDVVKADPKYFRCRDTNKTFTSITGFRAHLKSRQRAGQISSETASKATPVEVKVLDSYLTVADTRKAKGPGSPADQTGAPARLCSLRAILLLEDMGTTGDPDDKAWLDEEAHYSPHVRIQDGPHLGSPTQASPSYATDFDGRGATGSARRISESGVVNLPGEAEGRGAGMDAERARREWEQWRLREETAFAKRLREKDQALEEKWEARESARRRDLMHAQTDYSKLEGKLRKALSEVEARERQLKAREESWRSEHAQKISELQLLQRRLREETKHQVELERMKVKALEKQVSSHAKALEDARARVTATDEDLERFRQQQRRTPEGGLRQEIFRLGAAKAEAEAQVERERSSKNKALLEKEEYRAHIHKLARTIKLHQERESTCARREMEQLRLEYMAREERFHLDGDRNELRSIKQELDELRHVSVVQEAQANLAKVNTGPASTNNENTAPTSAPAVDATAPLPSSTAAAGVVGVVRTAPLSGSKAPTATGLGTSGYPSSRAPTVVGTSGLHSGNHGAPVTTETPYPGPSPSPPPRPTPAPATSAVSVRREAGSMSWGSAGQPTGRVGYGGTSQGTDRGGYRGTSILEARGGGSSNFGSVNSRGVHSGSGKNDGGAGVDGSGASDDGEGDVERLVGWRDDLLATGMYTSQNPIVSEMNRRIAEANRRRAEGSQRQE